MASQPHAANQLLAASQLQLVAVALHLLHRAADVLHQLLPAADATAVEHQLHRAADAAAVALQLQLAADAAAVELPQS